MSYSDAKNLAWSYAKRVGTKQARINACKAIDAMRADATPEDALAYYGIF